MQWLMFSEFSDSSAETLRAKGQSMQIQARVFRCAAHTEQAG